MAMLAENHTVNIRDEIVNTPPPFVSSPRMKRGNSLPGRMTRVQGIEKGHLQKLKVSNEIKSRFIENNSMHSVQLRAGSGKSKGTSDEPCKLVHSVSSTVLNNAVKNRTAEEYEKKLRDLKLELSETTQQKPSGKQLFGNYPNCSSKRETINISILPK